MQHQEFANYTEATLHDFKAGLGTFTQKMPNIAEHFNALTEACFKGGVVSEKEKQMIALGISVFSQDEYCIIYHLKGCLDQGCTEEEILETVGVSLAFGGGAAMSQIVTLVQDTMDELTEIQQ
ncbi:carboxymuconolactone decarboxylase family protein [Bacillus sp. Marseille-P3661]|uniref:carboxymuconolactone decarboxylase family protein n=1 Tax=Bacillus sp. Marseille-P3661 TaxID=1936234 RepID=UPI000C82B855|nr:carboxymuconolactone decarboxylase family protein [Bacillus sp. Marseille-P3661]